MRQLVFIHGRAQQRKNADALKAEWVDAWRAGLALSGLTMPIPAAQVHFPYYGDTLDQLVHRAPGRKTPEVIVRGADADHDERDFLRAYLTEVQRKFDIADGVVQASVSDLVAERGPLNWNWVQAILTTLDARVPGASGATVALTTRDVYQYLTNPGVRDTIDIGVRKAFTPGEPAVVVAHSLGSVVAYNVLRRDGQALGWQVPLFVTVGSPLAVRVVRNKLTPIAHPACVTRWFNAMDDRDVVALYPLDAAHFGVDPAIENKTDVRNRTANRHGIIGYLDDAVVARRIYDALVAS